MRTIFSPEELDFRDQIVALLAEIRGVLHEIDKRLADEERIAELGRFIGEEYQKLGERSEDRNQDQQSQLVERIRPLQDEIDSRYRQSTGTKHDVARFLQKLRDTLNRAPTAPGEIRDLRSEMERLELLTRGIQLPGWRRARTDLATIRQRLEEILHYLPSEAVPAGSGERPQLSMAGTPSAGPLVPDQKGQEAAERTAIETTSRIRKPMAEIRRERIELWDRLAVELATIRQATKKYTSLQGLKRKYPGFLLWSILMEAEQRELLSEDFRPRAYAGNLVLRRYGLASLETLRKDRAKLRKASRNRP